MRLALVFFLVLLSACRPAASTGALPDFTPLVEKNAPAVVNISTSLDPEKAGQNLREQVPEFLKKFFEGLEEAPQMPSQPESSGSGFIIEEDGYILTNRHVVDGADRIIVRLSDRRELEATLVGQDPRSDLALLKVDADDLPTVTIGSSEKLKVGEWVLAIGAPFGFDSSVTAGIVSAKGRSLPSENYVPFIQTDVAINPGNSGGPLFNLEGEVVGINSQIISRNGGYMGLSFAIPIDMAMDVVAQLKDSGKVSRGWLGVLIQPVDRDLAASFGLDKPTGALVAQVLADSPAQKSGIQAGDVILSFDGEEIEESSELPQVVGLVPAGESVKAEIMRDGKRQTLTVTVGELPDDAEARFSGSQDAPSDADALGLTVAPLSQQDRERLNLDHGVQVLSVADGPAADAGVQPGDIILSLANQTITSPEQFAGQVSELPSSGTVPMLISRDGNSRFLAIKLK